ncbi:hypothetical protein EZS27_013476 [termite gut metagenome]|uniref:Modification methylase EcoRI n=1 Tax=termite gut metagenome TaxID=433724 RepID=A0A5J4RZ57_9ZZZZ
MRLTRKQRLEKSQKDKDDEYYTLFEDISAELQHYKEQLKGKRIICPCDWDESYNEEVVYKEESSIIQKELFSNEGTIKKIDILASKKKFEKDLEGVKCEFVKFFVANAEDYYIQSISVSGYSPNADKGVKFQNVDYSLYDVVITNPPFSLFGEFIDTMMNNNMEFIVIGPQNAITYKNCFKYIQENRMWIGNHYHLSGFRRPDGTVLPKSDNIPRSCCWFTNLDVEVRHSKIPLVEEYCGNESTYPNYYNYNAINVNKTNSIPYDYDGFMGVPITFLPKFNPDQFEIIGLGKYVDKIVETKGNELKILSNNGELKIPYERIIIRNKNPYKGE